MSVCNSAPSKTIASHAGIRIAVPRTKPSPNNLGSKVFVRDLLQHEKRISPVQRKAINRESRKATWQKADHGQFNRSAVALISMNSLV